MNNVVGEQALGGIGVVRRRDFPLKRVTPGNGVEKIRPTTIGLDRLREQDVGICVVCRGREKHTVALLWTLAKDWRRQKNG